MTLDIHNWSSSVYREIHKIVKDKIFSIVNQVDTRVQNFEIQFLKEAAKFFRDFKSLAKEPGESLAKHKTLKLEIERLLRAVENEYAKLWNDWYKECKECKYDKNFYDKTYNDMQQKIERLQAQLGDHKGKSKDTSSVSDTLDPLPQKLENENVELEFQNSREEKSVAKKPIKASVRTNSITVSQPHVITKKVASSDSNGFSSTGSSRIKNKEVEVEEHPRNLLLSKNKKHTSSECDNVKLAIRNDKSEIVCTMCKQCLIAANHDVCVLNYVNGMNSRDKKQKINVSNIANQTKHMPQVKKPKKHMIGNLKLLINFFWKFLGTVRFGNDHVAAILGKSKRASHPPKPVPNSKQRLHLLHMDLCGPMRIASINGKRYVLVIVDDYSRYTWNQVLQEYFNSVGISHQASSVHTPQQNGVVKRRNRTLVEAARTMLIFSRTPLFLWAEAIATACYTQNRSITHLRFDKTPYELINGKKLDISFLHVFGALCYPKNDCEDIGKLSAKGDIGFFIGYSANSCGYRVYNRRTKKIIKTMNVTFVELSIMAFEQSSELDLLFEAMYDDHIGGQPSAAPRTVLAAQDVDVIETQQQHVQHQPETIADNVFNAMFDENTFVNPFATSSTSAVESSSSQYVDPSNMHTFYQPYPHEYQWTKDHPLEQVIGEPSRSVLTRYQLRSDGDMCMYAFTALYGFKQVPRAWYDELSTFLLHNYVFKGTIDPTLFIRRFDDDILVVQVYVADIIFGSTHPRPDIIHATCLCARYQAKPTEKHLKEVKRIFRYLRGTVNMGLWYTKDSGFELIGFSDADYAGCKDTFKSTFGGA
nr:hypothetical protein [Tanacetum cinerariifolium]